MSAPKTILIVSPQSFDWPVSKRHYATAMAKAGHRVYFLEPLVFGFVNHWRETSSEDSDNLVVVNVGLCLPPTLAFRLQQIQYALYVWLMRKVAGQIAQKLPSLDLVISFDQNAVFPCLKGFKANKNGLMVVDRLGNFAQRHLDTLCQHLDFVGGITPEFVADFKHRVRSTAVFHHGLQKRFVELAHRVLNDGKDLRLGSGEKVVAGLVGAVTHPSTDFVALRSVVEAFPECRFEFWGPIRYAVEDKRDLPNDAYDYYTFLEDSEHVTLHGMTKPETIIEAVDRVDIWLACYDAKKDPNADEKGVTNSHKLMEYLATGRPVVCNYFTMYDEVAELMHMLPTSDNSEFLNQFTEAYSQLQSLGDFERVSKQIEFARTNSYDHQAARLVDLMLAS